MKVFKVTMEIEFKIDPVPALTEEDFDELRWQFQRELEYWDADITNFNMEPVSEI